MIAKRLGSTYRPGKRTKDWLKIKNRRRVELTIGGYTAGDGNRSGTFGALLVGQPIAGSDTPRRSPAASAPASTTRPWSR